MTWLPLAASPGEPLPPTRMRPDAQQLFETHAASLCKVIHLLTDSRSAAEGITREVFRAFPEAWDASPAPGDPGQFLYRSAMGHVRALWSAPGGPPSPAPTAAARPGERLRQLIASLPVDEREVFVLYEADRERTPEEVAGILGADPAEVVIRLERAQGRLRSLWAGGER